MMSKKQRKARLGLLLAVLLVCAVLASLSPVSPSVSVSGQGVLSLDVQVDLTAQAAMINRPPAEFNRGDPPASPGGENWLGNYTYRYEIPITAASPDAQSATWTRQPSEKDARINETNPTWNYGGETFLVTRHMANNNQRSILQFDLSTFSPPSGYSITNAYLGCYYYADVVNDAGGNNITAYKVKGDGKPGDPEFWVEGSGTGQAVAGVTWDDYNAGAWDAGGGDYEAVTPTPANADIPADFGWMTWDIKAIVDDAIANESGIVNVLLIQTEGADLELPFFASKTYAFPSQRPKLEIEWTATPSVPANYKVYLDVFSGSPTVEDGTWTVNSKTYNHRIPFTITANDALPSGYPVKVVIDTEKLVDAGVSAYFASNAAGNATTVEFGNSTGGNTSKYWVQSALGVPKDFNTDRTIYWLAMPSSMSANTTYTKYLYVDKDQAGASSNHDPDSVWSLFEDFDTAAANLAAFEAAYPLWEEDPDGNGAIVSVAADSSVLHVDSTNDLQWDGIATKATYPSGSNNFRTLIRYTEAPTVGCAAGMFDAGGIGAGANKDGLVCLNIGGKEIRRYVADAETDYDFSYHAHPFIVELTKYDAEYLWVMYRDDADDTPDTYYRYGEDALFNLVATDVAHKVVVASYNTNAIDLDYIAVGPLVENNPRVEFPDILYPEAGRVFCNNNHEHWPYDTALTDDDGKTQLKWLHDDLAELTLQPSDSMPVAIRVTDDLSGNQSIYVYCGNAAQSSFDASHSGSGTFDTWDNFADATAWTEVSGTWTTPDVEEPVLRRGAIGNVGGEAGRFWARMPIVVKKGTGDFRMVFGNTLWHHSALGWPTPYRVYGATATALGEEFTPGERLFTLPELEGHVVGYFPESIEEDGGTYYASISRDGMEVAYSTTMDADDWTILANGPFVTVAWVEAQGNWSDVVSSVMSYRLLKIGSRWWCIYSGVIVASGNERIGAAYNDNDPGDWTLANWVDVGPIISDVLHLEDLDVGDDGDDNGYWHIFCSTVNAIHRFSLDKDAFTFPATDGDWVDHGEIDLTRNTCALAKYGSPRLIFEDGDWWLHFFGQGYDDTTGGLHNRWLPNYIFAAKCATLDGAWVVQNLDKKYYQSDTAASLEKAYVTASDYRDVEIIADVMVRPVGTYRMAGILFRYNSTDDNGYWALLDGSAAGPLVRLYKMTGGSIVELATEVAIPEATPLPTFYPGYEWRLRVEAYGDKIKVSYSPWGSEWVTAFDLEDGSYTNGKVGAMTYLAAGYFDKFRVRELVLTEPVVGTPGSGETFAMTNAPSSYDFGAVDESSSYWTKSGTSVGPTWPLDDTECYFTANNTGTEAIDITIVATKFTGGGNWTLGAAPGADTVTLKVGVSGNQTENDMTTLTTVAQNFRENLAGNGTAIKWEIKLETGTFSDGVLKTSILTLTASLH